MMMDTFSCEEKGRQKDGENTNGDEVGQQAQHSEST